MQVIEHPTPPQVDARKAAIRTPVVGALVERACPACAAAPASFERERGDGAKLVTCDDCGLLYVSPAPRAAALRDFYAGYYSDYRALVKPSRSELERQAQLRAFDPLTAFALQTRGRTPTSVADVGCGQGARLVLLSEIGSGVVRGSELDASAADFARTEYRIDVVQGDASVIERPPNGFDVVFLSEVIEHVLDPIDLLTGCARLLAPDGLLFISTPNAGVRWRAGADWQELACDFDHLSYFDDHSLRVALSKAGLRAREVLGWNLPSESAEMARLRGPRVLVRLQNLYSRVLNRIGPRSAALHPSWGFQLLCSATHAPTRSGA